MKTILRIAMVLWVFKFFWALEGFMKGEENEKSTNYRTLLCYQVVIWVEVG